MDVLISLAKRAAWLLWRSDRRAFAWPVPIGYVDDKASMTQKTKGFAVGSEQRAIRIELEWRAGPNKTANTYVIEITI